MSRLKEAVEAANERTRKAADTTGSNLGTAVETTRSYEWLTATKTLLLTLVFLPIGVVSTFLSVLPPAWRVWHKIHRWSAYQMQKAANADTLANVRREKGHEDLLPAGWVESDEDDKNRSGWKVKGLGDKRYDPAVHGRSTARMGKASLIHINEDDTEQGTWAEAAIDNALQLNREQYLFRDATLMARAATFVGDQAGNGQQTEGAVADGGLQRPVKVQDISIHKPGICEDILVPIGSRQGYDGQVISWNQYQNVKKSQADQETVRDAKNSAWAAAKLDEIEGKDMIKWALILSAIGFVLLFHQQIGAFIAGFAGGGGGGAVGTGLGMMMPVGGI